MQDLNYFSILKKQRQKNKNLRIMIISTISIVLVLTAALLGLGYYTFNKLEDQIMSNETYINAPATKARVRDAEIVKKELAVAKEYLSLIDVVVNKFNTANTVKVELIDYIRSLAPASTYFSTSKYEGVRITLECFSENVTDPMNFYHRLLNDQLFSYVSMPIISIEENGYAKYSIQLILKGGEPS